MTILTNAKHEAVALAYIADPEKVGWRAYRSVYPKSSRHAAECGFTRLQKNVEFAARIAELGKEAARGAVMTAQQVLEELTKLACANMQDYMKPGPDGDPVLDFAKLTREQASALQEVTVDRYTEGRGEDAREVKRVKFKLADKLRALELLGKHYALFTERHVHELGGRVAERLAAALARVDERANDNVPPPPRGAAQGSTYKRLEETGTSAHVRKRRERRRARP
jgi:phage terminase small subunit